MRLNQSAYFCAALLFAIGAASVQAAAPANDNFANRILLSGASVSTVGSTVDATGEVGEPNYVSGALKSVWWRWVAPANGNVIVSTSGSDFNTFLGLYTGSAVNQLTLKKYNDDFFYMSSEVTISVTAGTEYQISVVGSYSQSGIVALNIRLEQPPLNDNFADATPITDITVPVMGTCLGATRQSGEPAHAQLREGVSVWWRWTPSVSTGIRIDTVGSPQTPVLAIYTGTSLASLQPISSGYLNHSSQAAVAFFADAGTTYMIAVDAYAPRADRNVRLNFHSGTLVSMQATVHSTSEGSAQPAVLTITRSGPTTGALDVELKIQNSGSAVSGVDYVAVPTTATIPAGQASTTVQFTSIDDARIEPRGELVISVINSTTVVTHPQSIGLSIFDNDRPPNDDFANRITMTGLPAFGSGTDLNGTIEAEEPDHYGESERSVWYSWTASDNTGVVVEATPLPSSYYTFHTVAVYTGSTLDSLTPVASAGSSSNATCGFSAVAGTTYIIAVDSETSEGTTFNLNILNAVTVSVLTTDDTASETGDTATFTIQRTGSTATDLVVNLTISGSAIAGTDYQTLPATLTIPAGATSATLTLVPIDDALPEPTESVIITLMEGIGYGHGLNNRSATVRLLSNEAPPNDNFANSTVIPGIPATVMGWNTGATTEPNEPQTYTSGSRSVWWSWTAPQTMGVSIDTAGSEYVDSDYNILLICSGTSLSTLYLMSEDYLYIQDERMQFIAEAGKTLPLPAA